MSDHDLLTLAAKAANIKGRWVTVENGNRFLYRKDNQQMWNPLIYSEDAFHLAVKLRLKIVCDAEQSEVSDDQCLCCIELHGNDADAATRRAIVRAAAAIGKALTLECNEKTAREQLITAAKAAGYTRTDFDDIAAYAVAELNKLIDKNKGFQTEIQSLRRVAFEALDALQWVSDCYLDEDDDAGECSSCHERSYKPHSPDCKKNNAIEKLKYHLGEKE